MVNQRPDQPDSDTETPMACRHIQPTQLNGATNILPTHIADRPSGAPSQPEAAAPMHVDLANVMEIPFIFIIQIRPRFLWDFLWVEQDSMLRQL